MKDPSASVEPALDHARAFAWFALLAGALSLLLLVATLQPTPQGAAQQLSFYPSHLGRIMLSAVVVLAWAVFSIPFVVALGRILRPKSAAFALTATLLSTVGILLLGFAIFAHVGAVLSILAAGRPPDAADATYQAAIWGNLFFYLTDPGLMTWGAWPVPVRMARVEERRSAELDLRYRYDRWNRWPAHARRVSIRHARPAPACVLRRLGNRDRRYSAADAWKVNF